MSLILNIETSTASAFVSLGLSGETLKAVHNEEQKDHARFLQPAIQLLLNDAGITINHIDAIAVSAGPGSYTGLRVAMASAKGLSYALKKPLISISTLEIMAFSAILENEGTSDLASTLFCPMIDARRMEVFTALYNPALKVVMQPCAMILDNNSFAYWLLKNKILFFGNGAAKFRSFASNENAIFLPILNNVLAMSKLTHQKYLQHNFADLAYSEPFYLKEFFDQGNRP
ncbi:MAG: tRNA (adenosine(37)-N6)-threonylcarbamoyltransferase complex dimerization subunit type 1 TsaB [Aquabacterium sp.]|nr:tRNA (adenosine(37)-N6)-threonylcarbamoyltransferase complex dimerization subunit type 1 TsaB [Ferruginibacter sp.]